MNLCCLFLTALAAGTAAMLYSNESTTTVADYDMPKLPNFFKTRIQWNIMVAERRQFDMPLGMTVDVTQLFDGEKKRGKIVFRTAVENVETGKASTLEQKVIYNPDENIMLTIEIRENVTKCSAGSIISDDQLFPYLFWHNMSDPTAHPSVYNILEVGQDLDYSYAGQDTLGKIPCNVWETTITEDREEANLKVIFWWSDPSQWTSSLGAGKSVPVRACVTGVAHIQNQLKDIEHIYNFYDFDYNFPPSEDVFQPPADLYCEDREGYMKLPDISKFFSYKSEIMGYFPTITPDNKLIGIVQNQQTYYDYEWQVSRLDYKPISFESYLTGKHSKTGTITEIHEFKPGITYKIDNLLGNCTVSKINAQNDEDTDINTLVNGKVSMADPMSFLSMNESFYYNGKFIERGIPAEVYIARKKGVKDIIYVWYISSDRYFFQEGQQIQHRQPLKLIMYHHNRYDDPFSRMELSFYDFNEEEPSLQLYDISPCYDFNHKKQYIFSLPGTRHPLSEYMEDFRHNILSALSTTALVSPLRITNIEIELQRSKIYIQFTLLDKPPIFGDSVIPELEIGLLEASINIETSINSETLVIQVPVQIQLDKETIVVYTNVTAEPNTLKEVDKYNTVTVVNSASVDGYSSGSMVGLAFGMVFLGLLLASGIYVLVLRGKVVKTTSTTREHNLLAIH